MSVSLHSSQRGNLAGLAAVEEQARGFRPSLFILASIPARLRVGNRSRYSMTVFPSACDLRSKSTSVSSHSPRRGSLAGSVLLDEESRECITASFAAVKVPGFSPGLKRLDRSEPNMMVSRNITHEITSGCIHAKMIFQAEDEAESGERSDRTVV